MTYSNSPLIDYTKLSPCNSGTRTHDIDRITPHCVVGQCSIEALGDLFQNYSRQTSSNYGIGKDGRIGLFVPESQRAWTSSSSLNDQRAITVECASATVAPYAFYDWVYDALVDLCEDICKRYGKDTLLWIPDKTKALAYEPKNNEILLTVHRWFANKSCPGDWLYNRLGELAKTVTERLKPKFFYRVQIGAFSLKLSAELYAKKAAKLGYPCVVVNGTTANGKTIYRVQCGAFAERKNAEAYAKSLRGAGFDAIITEVAVK